MQSNIVICDMSNKYIYHNGLSDVSMGHISNICSLSYNIKSNLSRFPRARWFDSLTTNMHVRRLLRVKLLSSLKPFLTRFIYEKTSSSTLSSLRELITNRYGSNIHLVDKHNLDTLKTFTLSQLS